MIAAPDPAAEPAHATLRALEALRTCLARLAPAAREIIQLRYFSQYGPSEISRLRECSVNAVNVTLARARTALRVCMQQALHSASQ
jgi:RNA polymerase sigma factor (sigma-70 family)